MASAREYLQSIIDQLKIQPKTIAALPPALASRYQNITDLTPIWPQILREVSSEIIATARPFIGDNQLTVESIVIALRILNIPSPYNTFLISGANGLDHQPLRNLLQGYRFTEVTIQSQPPFVGVMILEQKKSRWDRRAFHVSSFIKSLIDDNKRVITDKGLLYTNLYQLNPDLVRQHMAATAYTSQISTVDGVLIVKPVGDVGLIIGGGRDIEVVTSTSELRRVEATLKQKYRTEPIASFYIPDPWLIGGRKCHFRMYFLVRSAGVSISGVQVPYAFGLWDRGKILTAAEPFVMADFQNPRIHDSHAKTTDQDRYFDLEASNHQSEMTLEERSLVFAQMQTIMATVGQLMQTHTKSFPESTNGFEVFGVDFMVRRGPPLNVVLIEINDHVGYDPVTGPGYDPEFGPWTDEFRDFSRRYWEWGFAYAIAPYYDLA